MLIPVCWKLQTGMDHCCENDGDERAALDERQGACCWPCCKRTRAGERTRARVALRPIGLLLLIAALIASPVPWVDVHEACGVLETSMEDASGTSPMLGAIPTADGAHLHFDQCCQHAQVEASVTTEAGSTLPAHPPQRPRHAVLPGIGGAPYRPPIA